MDRDELEVKLRNAREGAREVREEAAEGWQRFEARAAAWMNRVAERVEAATRRPRMRLMIFAAEIPRHVRDVARRLGRLFQRAERKLDRRVHGSDTPAGRPATR